MSQLPDLKILIVDDFLMIRILLKASLNELGVMEIHEAQSGDQGWIMLLESAKGRPYDFIFSDWHMPGLNGYQLLRQVRGNSTLKDIPFFMVSAESEPKHIMDAIRAGADEFITKPFVPRALVEKMTHFINKKQKSA